MFFSNLSKRGSNTEHALLLCDVFYWSVISWVLTSRGLQKLIHFPEHYEVSFCTPRVSNAFSLIHNDGPVCRSANHEADRKWVISNLWKVAAFVLYDEGCKLWTNPKQFINYSLLFNLENSGACHHNVPEAKVTFSKCFAGIGFV